MLRGQTELEPMEDYNRRCSRAAEGWQRTYEALWDLREVFGKRFFDAVTKQAFEEMIRTCGEGVGRRRFYKVGPVRIPLTAIRQSPTVIY